MKWTAPQVNSQSDASQEQGKMRFLPLRRSIRRLTARSLGRVGFAGLGGAVAALLGRVPGSHPPADGLEGQRVGQTFEQLQRHLERVEDVES